MKLDIDPSRPIPLYLQIVQAVERLIALGALLPGDRLPTVRELAASSRVNRNTAGKAFRELESRGVVRTRVGQGTFVAEASGADATPDPGALLGERIDELLDEARVLRIPGDEVLRQVRDRLEARGDEESDG